MWAGLRTMAALCAILPLSWDHQHHRYPLSKTGFRPARGAFATARHQRPVGAKPLWRSYVAASALPVGGALAGAIVANCLVAFVEPLSMPRRKLT